MLTKQSREDLRWAVKAALLEQSKKIEVKEARQFVKNFILKEATYEQLLNLAFNPYRDEVYMESDKLEVVAKTFVQEGLSGKSGKKAIALLESYIKEGPTDWARKVVEPTVHGIGKAAGGVGKAAGWTGGKIGDAASYVGGKASGAAKYLGGKASGAAQYVGQKAIEHPKTAVGATAAALATGGYLVYRKMRAAGKSKEEAAAAAAAAETDPAKKDMWMSKSQEWAD